MIGREAVAPFKLWAADRRALLAMDFMVELLAKLCSARSVVKCVIHGLYSYEPEAKRRHARGGLAGYLTGRRMSSAEPSAAEIRPDLDKYLN
jgi:hypothetical protein